MANETPPDDGSTTDVAPKRRSTDNKSRKPVPKKNPNMKRTGRPAHGAEALAQIELQLKALEYRKMGLNYAQIAEKMGWKTAQSAWNNVDAALKRTLQEPANDVRKLELERLDAMFIPVYGNAMRGDLMAIASALNIMTRRARLLGLDAPDKKELTGKDGAPLTTGPQTIIIGGPGEVGEPETMGESVDPASSENSQGEAPTVAA